MLPDKIMLPVTVLPVTDSVACYGQCCLLRAMLPVEGSVASY